jgi:hypothetical protein
MSALANREPTHNPSDDVARLELDIHKNATQTSQMQVVDWARLIDPLPLVRSRKSCLRGFP